MIVYNVGGTQGEGVVRFVGEVPFASGVHVGVELTTPDGECDGSVDGVTYFETKPFHAHFAHIYNVSAVSSSTELAKRRNARQRALASRQRKRSGNKGATERKKRSSLPADASNELLACLSRLAVGDSVMTHNYRGVIRYIGEPAFGSEASPVWIGIELDKAVDLAARFALKKKGFFYSIAGNDGTIMGKTYFTTKEGRALFATPSNVLRVLPCGTIEPSPAEQAKAKAKEEEPVQVRNAHVVRYRRKRPASASRAPLSSASSSQRTQRKPRISSARSSRAAHTRRLSDELLSLQARELKARALRSDENVMFTETHRERQSASRTKRRVMDRKRAAQTVVDHRRNRLLSQVQNNTPPPPRP